MAITRMTTKAAYDTRHETGAEIVAVENYHGCDKTLYMQTTHRGLVLETRERNGYHDSDFYANVWNPETGTIEQVEYASTRGWTYPCNATVDATDEVVEAANAYLRKRAEARYVSRHEAEHAVPSKGKRVRVTSKRSKVPHGTEGVVFWRGKSGYGVSRYGSWGKPSYRVGFNDDAWTTHWCSETCVEVIDPYAPPTAAEIAYAGRCCAQYGTANAPEDRVSFF